MGITHEWHGTVLTITSDSGTSSCDLQGPVGETGIRGPQGIHGINGRNGVDGTVAFEELTEGQKLELKGDRGEPFKYEDFTAEQLEGLRGYKGDKGDRGEPFKYEDFTEEQLAALKGADGTMKFEDLTEEQKQSLAFKYEDFTEEQIEELRGYTPIKGVDYYTEAEKVEMIEAVIANIALAQGESF